MVDGRRRQNRLLWNEKLKDDANDKVYKFLANKNFFSFNSNFLFFIFFVVVLLKIINICVFIFTLLNCFIYINSFYIYFLVASELSFRAFNRMELKSFFSSFFL